MRRSFTPEFDEVQVLPQRININRVQYVEKKGHESIGYLIKIILKKFKPLIRNTSYQGTSGSSASQGSDLTN